MDMEPTMKYNILQTNLNRSREACDLAYCMALKKKLDFVTVSEPNKAYAERNKWYLDMDQDASIVPIGENIRVLGQGRERGIVWLQTLEFTIVNCYISPNVDLVEYRQFILRLQRVVRGLPAKAIICGDFNAYSKLWGSKTDNEKGDAVLDWIAADNLHILNRGTAPTFLRRGQESHIDITICDEELSPSIASWKVMEEEESLSDHQYILIEIERRVDPPAHRHVAGGWKVEQSKMPALTEAIKEYSSQTEAEWTAEGCHKTLQAACDKVFKKRKSGNGRKPVYWWTEEVRSARSACISAKRVAVRTNRRPHAQAEEKRQAQDTYKELRKSLRKAIASAKAQAWKGLLEDLGNDLWGLAYKIVCKRLKKHKPLDLTIEEQTHIVTELFPTRMEPLWHIEIHEHAIHGIDEAEITEAANALKAGKAPGPDGVPPEAVKCLAAVAPRELAEMMSGYLERGYFPEVWKVARLALIEKSSSGPTKSYRPICLLDTLGKLFERVILTRLEASGEQLSERQYGFRKGRSTIGAIEKVLEIGQAAARGAYQHRKTCALITLDVKNAFNSAPWELIVHALEQKETPQYLVNIVRSYLSNRKVAIEDRTLPMTCGVPQGSILGPYLWNIFYDNILDLPLPEGAETVAFADDLALIVTERSPAETVDTANAAISTIHSRMRAMALELAEHKTEMVLLYAPRSTANITVQIGNSSITSTNAIKYLGVWVKRNMVGTTHVKEAAKKAEKVAMAVARLMPNIGGPDTKRRMVLSNVVLSVALYATPTWENAMRYKKYRAMLDRSFRRAALRICRSYRTAPTAAIQVLAGIPPAHLKVTERTSIYRGKDKTQARADLLRDWQSEWDSSNEESWTRKLIPSVQAWTERSFGEIDYHVTQMFTGHGCFGTYLKRFKLARTDACWFCGETDSPEHTLLYCTHHNTVRQEAGCSLQPEGLSERMLQSESCFRRVANAIKKIMETKQEHERTLTTE